MKDVTVLGSPTIHGTKKVQRVTLLTIEILPFQ
jgi:hypothetical protein